jgi:hypothetical protein
MKFAVFLLLHYWISSISLVDNPRIKDGMPVRVITDGTTADCTRAGELLDMELYKNEAVKLSYCLVYK